MLKENKTAFLEWAEYSDTGLVRSGNEDSILSLPEDGCFAVADGMGGGDAGEVASSMVIDAIRNAIFNTGNEFPGERKYSLLQNLLRVNSEIIAYKEARNFRMMGSTVVAVLRDSWASSKIHCCYVGDSRIYCFRDGEIFQVSSDQTIGEEMRKNSNSAMNIPEHMFGVLTQAVGGAAGLCPAWREITVFENDLLFLCSDGVTAVLNNRELEKIMQVNFTPAAVVNAVKEQVLSGGAPDNFSMICVKISSFPDAPVICHDDKMENELLMRLSEKLCISKKKLSP